jgi:hypothetical protein
MLFNWKTARRLLRWSVLIGFGYWMHPAHASWKPEYAQSSPQVRKFYQNLQNKKGGSCCGEADAIAFYDDYSLNPDGSVDLVFEGNQLHFPEWMVTKDANPTGHAIIWVNTGRTTYYCFTPGGGW